eukprot:1146709-Alexandrium_andersonii.AAC.1
MRRCRACAPCSPKDAPRERCLDCRKGWKRKLHCANKGRMGAPRMGWRVGLKKAHIARREEGSESFNSGAA